MEHRLFRYISLVVAAIAVSGAFALLGWGGRIIVPSYFAAFLAFLAFGAGVGAALLLNRRLGSSTAVFTAKIGG